LNYTPCQTMPRLRSSFSLYRRRRASAAVFSRCMAGVGFQFFMASRSRFIFARYRRWYSAFFSLVTGRGRPRLLRLCLNRCHCSRFVSRLSTTHRMRSPNPPLGMALLARKDGGEGSSLPLRKLPPSGGSGEAWSVVVMEAVSSMSIALSSSRFRRFRACSDFYARIPSSFLLPLLPFKIRRAVRIPYREDSKSPTGNSPSQPRPKGRWVWSYPPNKALEKSNSSHTNKTWRSKS
jgi:hypothetical protein